MFGFGGLYGELDFVFFSGICSLVYGGVSDYCMVW